jgi:hypothetical protein
MNPGQFRSLLSGKRRWNTSYIEIIANKLSIDLFDLIKLILDDNKSLCPPPTLEPKVVNEIGDLLDIAYNVLISGDTETADALRANIMAFNKSIERYDKYERKIVTVPEGIKAERGRLAESRE